MGGLSTEYPGLSTASPPVAQRLTSFAASVRIDARLKPKEITNHHLVHTIPAKTRNGRTWCLLVLRVAQDIVSCYHIVNRRGRAELVSATHKLGTPTTAQLCARLRDRIADLAVSTNIGTIRINSEMPC